MYLQKVFIKYIFKISRFNKNNYKIKKVVYEFGFGKEKKKVSGLLRTYHKEHQNKNIKYRINCYKYLAIYRNLQKLLLNHPQVCQCM